MVNEVYDCSSYWYRGDVCYTSSARLMMERISLFCVILSIALTLIFIMNLYVGSSDIERHMKPAYYSSISGYIPL